MTELPLPKYRADEIEAGRATGTCPLLLHDWYAMPRLFEKGNTTFGAAWFNDRGRSRRGFEAQLDFACSVWREKYPGGCNKRRVKYCYQLMLAAMDATAHRPPEVPPQPWLITVVKRLVNAEEVHAAMKSTMPVFRPAFEALNTFE